MKDSYAGTCEVCGKKFSDCRCDWRLVGSPTGYCRTCGKLSTDCKCTWIMGITDSAPHKVPKEEYPTKPILYVRWEDIMDYGDRAPMSIARERRLAVTETCGFVISEDDETITLDQHICHIPEITEPAVQNYTVIPKVLVKESRPCNLGVIDKEER